MQKEQRAFIWRCSLYAFDAPIMLFAVTFVRYGQLFTAFCTTGSQYTASISGKHALAEAMLVVPLAVVRLKCPFHFLICLFVISVSFNEVQNYEVFLIIQRLRCFLCPIFFFTGQKSKVLNEFKAVCIAVISGAYDILHRRLREGLFIEEMHVTADDGFELFLLF